MADFLQLYAGGGDRTRMGLRPKDFKSVPARKSDNDLAVPLPSSVCIRMQENAPESRSGVTQSDTRRGAA